MKAKLLSAALTGLVLATTATAAEKTNSTKSTTTMGECHGVNACKGQGQCGGQGHGCAGSNSCKGLGWVTMTEKECVSKKGQWKKMSGMMHAPTTKK
jgi:uncharacterized membrane protein